MYSGTVVGKHWSRRLRAFLITAFNVLSATDCGFSCGLIASTKAVGAAGMLVENGTYEPPCIALWTDMQYFKTYQQQCYRRRQHNFSADFRTVAATHA